MVISTMILRALLIALSCACAYALTPLATGGDEECALYLNGGRTSAYDYSLNLLRGNFAYESQHTCITYEAINQAYLEARKRILVAQPKGDWTPEDYASVGELVLDISTNLARRYGLTYEEIEKGLPLIDTSRTLIAEVCPPVFSHVECRAGKYRRLDGLCNNLEHPTWGSTNVPFQRLIGPLFADGINSPRIAHSGHDLPLSRVVSRTIHPDDGFHDHAGTVMVIAWGQFMDHDYTLTATPLDPRNRNDPEECCKRPLHQKHPYCNEIRIPDDDYFYRLFGVKCIDFVRAFPSPRPGCRLGSRIPYNTLTGVLDGNTVYGVTDKFARKLRTGYGGLLRMNDVFKEYGLKDLLPLKLDIPDEGCTRPNKNMYCFEAGEIRVNEQLVLTVMHTLMAREHNRVAKGLAGVNPHWDDETLFQEARRINIAEIQHITYNEFLPILLGKDVMEKFGLVLEKKGYWDGYDTNVNPDVIASFASAAYRFGHSLLPTAIERWSKAHKFIASKRLSDLIRRPYDLYRAGVLDEYIMGLMNQVAQAMDDSITQEVTNHLFKKVGARFGMDLVSFNMQRGREFGIPGYMDFRKFCGLSGADSFQDLFGSMPNETVRKYESIFEHPSDVDLWSGGVSERPLPGSMLGPTFACIIATQFSYSRRGDRFWFELPNQPSSFTPQQLKEVRKSRMARVICDNTDIIDTVQLYPMVLPDHELNPRVPCRSGIIPSMDFSAWAEQPPFAGPAKQFVTDAVIENKTIAEWPKNDNITKEIKCNVNNSAECQPNVLNTTMLNLLDPTNETHENKTLTELNNDTDNNQPKESNTLLKYIYKNKEKQEKLKDDAHPRNSLKRRKRTADDREINIKPLAFNYETTHSNENVNKPLLQNYEVFPPTPEVSQRPLPQDTETYIKNSDLASFDIKTLHDHIVNPRFKDEEYDKSNEKSRERDHSKQHDSKENVDSNENIHKSLKNKKPYGPIYSTFHPGNVQNAPSEEVLSQKYDTNDKNLENYDKSLSDDEKLKSEENSDGDDATAYRKRLQYEATELESKKPKSDENSSHSSNDESSEHKEPNKNGNERSKNYVKSHSKDESSENSSENDRSDSREVEDSQEQVHYNTAKSDETSRENYADSPKATPQYTDNNSEEKHSEKYYFKGRKPIVNSHEKYDKKNYESPDKETDKLNENNDDEDRVDHSEINSKPLNSESDYHNPKHFGHESNEKYKQTNSNEDNSNELEKYQLADRERSDDKKEVSGEDNSSDKLNIQIKKPTTPIQDVDLGDFSFERIKYDKKGKLVPVNDDHENSEQDPSSENVKSKDGNNSNSKEDLSSREVINPVQINDEEIKPIIEIDNEDDSESGEDDDAQVDLHDYKGRQIPFTSAEDPIKEKLSDASKTNEGKKKSVKHEFERIPLNYNHDYNVKKEDDSNSKEHSEEISDSSEPENSTRSTDETRDGSSPKNNRDDDNFDFKLSDSVLKLPEIKLPENVLTYNYDDYKPKKNKEKSKYYHYDNEKDKEDTKQENEDDQSENDDNDDHDYYHSETSEQQRHGKEDEAEKEEEDLYEKFVRERFGKTESYENRAEKLQEQRYIPVNPELQKQVQKILKRTEETGKQATKSGDPKAGYLWTLEYNENL